MNTLTTTLTTILLIGAATLASTTTQAAEFIAADNTPGTQVCMAVVANRPITLSTTMRDLRMNKNTAVNKLRCNDMQLAQFAGKYGFNKSAKFLNLDSSTKTSIQDLAKVNDDTILVVSGSK
ncbi:MULTISPECIES: DUF3718 domain-containing protein [unclassified Pseudoalteromonas]|uniref:DUF3718 domain-containing protein n=1 Tax=unclassified Pseudoalteromonas TaxID=194690 RepID=UPI000C074C57|nr:MULTISPECIES: DUF3718 domain-containing protein [unclassified Pseudoalteromonas]MDP2634750.1 DUF3718 domain-containing protein [Pseudoalteromonas sp. 1_MG-2023]PHN91351.1 hypothetical protein CSC79_03590 [Pseudoalteromonas sp. 3D05]